MLLESLKRGVSVNLPLNVNLKLLQARCASLSKVHAIQCAFLDWKIILSTARYRLVIISLNKFLDHLTWLILVTGHDAEEEEEASTIERDDTEVNYQLCNDCFSY